MAESVESRLGYLESEVISAGDISGRFDQIKEALGIVHGILDDLIKERDDAGEYAEDLDRLETIARFL
jgi:hypothetical protein